MILEEGTYHLIRYNVTFEANVFVPKNGSLKDEIASLNIPEDDISKYVEDSFEVIIDSKGNPIEYKGRL